MPFPNRCLIVDDDRDVARAMEQLASAQGWEACSVHTLAQAREALAADPLPDVVLLDLQLPDGSGLELLSSGPGLRHRCRVVVVTGHASITSTADALRLGAVDCLVKPVDADRLVRILAKHARCQAASPADAMHDPGADRFGPLIGQSTSMQRLYRSISRVAPSDASVFITGESGTGKDVAARAIVQFSRRRGQPLIAVNCGAISPGLIESELFGHLRGSFTGAIRDHAGLFERADGGTLFLDEICEMPLGMQARLLRVLEAGAFLPVGADRARTADVRIIAATNRVPGEAVAQGRLREDLFYRLNVFPIHVPPLRERQDDIALLASYFLLGVSGGHGRGHRFAPEALQRLLGHRWRGNVRELRNAVIRAHVMADGPEIGPELLDPVFGPVGPQFPAMQPVPAAVPARGPGRAPGHPAPPAAADRVQIAFEVGTGLADIEREVILATLARFHGHRERTAAALGLSPKTLYNRLRAYAAPRGRRGRTPAKAVEILPSRPESSARCWRNQ